MSASIRPRGAAVAKPTEKIVQFLRSRDYRLVKELGQGACGKTVLLHDDLISEQFVCKKFVPYAETEREELFANFVREVKLLHQVAHRNVVRVFNYYLYPKEFAGFILMEFIEGNDVDEYLANAPEKVNEIFLQAISGFSYLEANNILHRDIRPNNILVRTDGVVKIIDLGFGKKIESSTDFDKSITLNWWCDPPKEFSNSVYDFATEVYFVGKLFSQIIHERNIAHFNYREVLRRMCQRAPEKRATSFIEVEKAIQNEKFFAIDFESGERKHYQAFTRAIARNITKIERRAKYRDDIEQIETQLEDAYRTFMLEDEVPDAALISRCLIIGGYYYKKAGFPVEVVADFLRLLKSAPFEKKRIIIANLQTRLDAIERYTLGEPDDDDIPF